MLMLIVVAVAMLGGGAGGAWYFLQKRAAAATDDEPVAHAPAEKHAPTYLPLESMVVNLADGSGERFAQIGVTLDIDNEKTAEKIKTYMPAIRSSVLMLVSQRTSEELLRRDGKEKLANDIVTEVSRAIGYEVADAAPKAKPKADADGDAEESAPKRKKKRAVEPSPINGVLFSSFIVQ
ncbi:flagellar basal body protein FliL [Variovorax sp. PAMC 28711]|nr:flagellar basal body protein FliL [Variovorax sp. PAMC 28711]